MPVTKKGGGYMKLGDCAHLRTGLVLSRKQAGVNDEKYINYKQLTLKSISSEGIVISENLENFKSKEQLKKDYFTQKDDIVIRLSHPYTAVLIDEATKGILIPSHFVVIRCDEMRLNPGYLQWLINTDKVRNKISLSTSTNSLGTIRPKFFSDFEIDEISLNDQIILAAIYKLAKQELELLTKLKEQKQKYYNALADKIQKEMRKKK